MVKAVSFIIKKLPALPKIRTVFTCPDFLPNYFWTIIQKQTNKKQT